MMSNSETLNPPGFEPQFRSTGAARPPHGLLMLLEARAPWEYAATLAAMPWLTSGPRGDGHPVLVLPGMGASDLSTQPLRRFLHDRGYTPYAWGLGRNHGPRAGLMDACRRLVCELTERHGQKLSLVGWSLGGVYARELAKQLPAHTRCVITLGTPFSGHLHATNVARAYEMMGGRPMHHDPEGAARLRRAPSVPTTSIYSKTDGVVAWQCSLNDDEPHTENIEIHASHIGMGVNPLALYAVADRLRQDPANWRRFDTRAARRWFFRSTRPRTSQETS
jgi:pimeloyl-ACP methyl ester carboxylesterase